MMLKSVIDRRLYEEEKKINKLLEQVCLKADIKLDTQGFPIGLGNFSTKEPVSTQSAGTQTDTPFGAISASGKLFASSDDVDDDDIHSERSKQESIQSQSNLSKGWEAMLLEQVMKENEFLIQNQEKEKQELQKKIAELEQNLLEVIKWRNSTVNQSLFLISSFENKLSSGKEKGKSNKADLEKLISKLLYQLKSPLQEKINLSSQYAKNLLNQPLVNKSLSPAPSPLKSSQQLPVQYITQSPQVAEASNQPLEQFDKIAPQIIEPVNIPPPQPQTESSNFSKPKLKQTNEPPPPPPPAESPLILKPSDYKQTKQAQSRPVSFPLRKTNNPLLNFDSNDNSPREHANNPNLDQSQPSSVPQPPPPPPMSSPAPKPSVPPPPPATSPAPANPKSANAPPPPPAPGSDKKDLSIDPFSPMSSAKSPQKFLTDSQPSLSPSKIAQNADDANDSNEDHGKFYYCVKCKEYTLKMDLQLHEITIHSLFPFLTFELEQSLLQLFYLLAQMQYFHTNYGSTHPLQRQKEIDRIQHYQVLSSSKDNQDETDKYRRQIIQMSYVTKNVFLLFFLIFELFDEKFPLSKGNQILDFCLITASKKSGKYRLKFNYADFIFAIFQLIQEKYKNFPNSSSKTPSPIKGRKPASIPQKTESMDPDQILIGKVQFFLTSTRELTEYYLTNPKDLDHLMTLYWDLTSDTLLPLFADNQALLYNNFKRTKSYGLYKSELRLKKIDLIGGSFTPFENYCINYQLVPQLVPVSISRIITQDTKRLCGVENFTFFFFALYSTILYIARQDRTSNYNSVIPGRDGLKPASMPLERMKVILQQIIIQNDNEFS